MHSSVTTSPELIALGELEFRKAFLILNYIGNNRLEDVMTADMIRELKALPMSSFEEIWRRFGYAYVFESDRRHNHDWDSEMTNIYQCHIDLDERITFKCHRSNKISLSSFTEQFSKDMEMVQLGIKKHISENLLPLFSYCMSTASDSWLAFMDRLLTLGDDCEEEKQILQEKILKLVDIYYDALDAPKQGLKVEVPDYLRADMRPHFLTKKYLYNSYTSTSVLGEMFDMVNSSETDSKKVAEVRKLDVFEGNAPRSMETWQEHYGQYRWEMQQALGIQSKEAKDAAADAIIQKYRKILYGAADFEDRTRKEEDVLDEALAIYHICYVYAKQRDDVGRCSFAWRVAGQALCYMYPRKRGKGSIVCSMDALREVLG